MLKPDFFQQMKIAFGQHLPAPVLTGTGRLPSPFYVTDLATDSMAFAAHMLRRYSTGTDTFKPVQIDQRLASFWFGTTLRPQGWDLPGAWDAIAGNYRTADGWIRLHTNAPHHRQAALQILKVPNQRAAVSQAVTDWVADELEQAIVNQGGCAATFRTLTDWQQHPQGQAVHAEPLVHLSPLHTTPSVENTISPGRPLQGLKVLDLTRVLAGPAAGRFLAAYGAHVLRIDPPHWEEPGIIPEMTLGKRCARLDAKQTAGLKKLKALFTSCDVILHGYRPAALEHLGLGETVRHQLNPYAIDVSLNAYGWTGPWRNRRGFDSLVQMSSGIAHQGMQHAQADQPVPLPVQALDHATGYLMAAAVLQGLIQRREQGRVIQAKLSLARTAALLISAGHDQPPQSMAAEATADWEDAIEQTSWGAARRIRFPIRTPNCPARWDYPARKLGSAQAGWESSSSFNPVAEHNSTRSPA